MSLFVACPRCGGEGWVHVQPREPLHHAGRDVQVRTPRLVRCPHCRGEAFIRGRGYSQVRRCELCGKPFAPPLRPRAHEATVCRWCLRDATPAPAAQLP